MEAALPLETTCHNQHRFRSSSGVGERWTAIPFPCLTSPVTPLVLFADLPSHLQHYRQVDPGILHHGPLGGIGKHVGGWFSTWLLAGAILGLVTGNQEC